MAFQDISEEPSWNRNSLFNLNVLVKCINQVFQEMLFEANTIFY